MTTSFRAKFPASLIRNIRAFLPGGVSPENWSKQACQGIKTGDIIVCFNPFNTADGINAQLEVSATILVFNADQNGPQGILLTDEFYVYGPLEAIFRERAVASAARNTNFSFVVAPFIGTISEDAGKFLSSMQRWGSGTRANPVHGLPDPLVAFFACIGSPLPATPPVGIDLLCQGLLRGNFVAPIADLNTKFRIIAPAQAQASQPAANPPAAGASISSVTVIESAEAPSSPSGASAQPNPVKPNEAPAAGNPAPQSGASGTAQPRPELINPQATRTSGSTDASPGNFGSTAAGSSSSIPAESPKQVLPDVQSQNEQTAPAPGLEEGKAGRSASEPGFLSIRKRLEARLSGRLPKSLSSGSDSSAMLPARAEPQSPALKLVSNIRQQMSIASDNLEYRVSTLKSKMLDRLVSCKHNLGEKEQLSLKALEDLRTRMIQRLEYAAARAKDELSKCASEGTARVRTFQSRSPGILADLLAEQEKTLNESTNEAKRKVSESLLATRDELDKTVSRAQHTLRGLVTTTEVHLNQIVNQSSEGMDERIEGFRLQTNILAEGIGLSVESLGEAAKLQSQQSEEEVIKRLENLSEESLKSLREQSVKAEMECSKLIDKLSRDKLVPTLQEKRKVVVDLSSFFHDEFGATMHDLLENRLAEFEPIVRACSDAAATYLQEFKSRWTTALEQHQKDLDEMELKLRIKVDEYLSQSRAHLESMQDITKVTDYVLTSPELIRTRDETCLKFDLLAREHVSKAFSYTGERVNQLKQESIDELTELRQRSETMLKDRGEECRSRVRSSIKSAMQKLQELQNKYTA